VLTRPSRETTGNLFIDDEVLRTEGVTDFRSNRVDPELPDTEVAPDFFV
jgi:citronellol/citronellal dehydrogenase